MLPRDEIELKAFNLVGLDALQHLLSDQAPPTDTAPVDIPASLQAARLSQLVARHVRNIRIAFLQYSKGGIAGHR